MVCVLSGHQSERRNVSMCTVSDISKHSHSCTTCDMALACALYRPGLARRDCIFTADLSEIASKAVVSSD